MKSLTVSALSPVSNTTVSRAQVGSTTGMSVLNSTLGFTNPTAIGALFPVASAIDPIQAGNPKNLAAFGTGGTVPLLALGMLGDTGNGLSTPASAQLKLEFTQPVSGFTIGLLNPGTYSDTPFNTLEFEVAIDGSTALDMNFANLAAANAYFTDNVLNFNQSVQDVTVSLNMTADSTFDSYGINVEIGAVPEPATASFAMLGMTLFGFVRLRRDGFRNPMERNEF